MLQFPGAHKLERRVNTYNYLCLQSLQQLKILKNFKNITYQDSQTSAPKGNNEFKTLLVKIFSLNQKTNQIVPATVEKIKFCLFKKIVSCPFRLKYLLKK